MISRICSIVAVRSENVVSTSIPAFSIGWNFTFNLPLIPSSQPLDFFKTNAYGGRSPLAGCSSQIWRIGCQWFDNNQLFTIICNECSSASVIVIIKPIVLFKIRFASSNNRSDWILFFDSFLSENIASTKPLSIQQSNVESRNVVDVVLSFNKSVSTYSRGRCGISPSLRVALNFSCSVKWMLCISMMATLDISTITCRLRGKMLLSTVGNTDVPEPGWIIAYSLCNLKFWSSSVAFNGTWSCKWYCITRRTSSDAQYHSKLRWFCFRQTISNHSSQYWLSWRPDGSPRLCNSFDTSHKARFEVIRSNY